MRGTPFLQSGFTGGLNTIADPYDLEPNEARECLNVTSTIHGSIRKRFGSTQFIGASIPAGTLESLFAVTVSGTNWLIAADSEKLYSINTAKEITTIGEGFTSGKWSCVVAPESKEVASEGPVYLTNGKDATQYWTGAEKATKVKEWTGLKDANHYEKAPYVPQGKYMVYAGNRIWMTGVAGDTSAVWFSGRVAIGEGGERCDPSSWPRGNVVEATGGGVVRFDASDGYPITGIGLVGPYVVVFKEYKTWVIHNLNTGENRKLADTIGCIANRSIVETSHGTFFLTADQGVYLTNGSTLTEMSLKIRPTLLKINAKNRENAAGEYWNNHYYLSIPFEASETNNRTFDYDTQLKAWWPHDLAGNQWTRFAAKTGEPMLYTIPAKAKAGIVHAFDESTFQDVGVNYKGNGVLGAFWIGHWEPFYYFIFRHRIKAYHVQKRVRQIFFNGEGEIRPLVFRNFNVGERQEPAVVDGLEISKNDKLPVNFAAGSEKWAEGSGIWGVETAGTEVLWGGETSVGQARVYEPGVAYVWSFGWGNASSEGFVVNGFTPAIQFRKS